MSRHFGILGLVFVAALTTARSAHAQQPAPAAQVRGLTAPYPTIGSIERLDPALDALLAPDAKIETIAEGFTWAEGPLFVRRGAGGKKGALLFTDVPKNVIYRWTEVDGLSVFMNNAGYSGTRTDLKEPGANGLALDARGRLLMCQHGERRLARVPLPLAAQAAPQVVVDRFDGKRFNSPNDLVVHKRGEIFFTDPPYGLPGGVDDPGKELPFQGVYRVDARGTAHLLTKEVERPNGIALSPDGKTLYVANSFEAKRLWMAYPLNRDLSIGPGRVFFDATEHAKQTGRKGLPDGLAVDVKGNLFATGPGGVLVFSPAGKHLGTILTGELTANCKFGDDGRTLYITADGIVARVRTKTKGLGF